MASKPSSGMPGQVTSSPAASVQVPEADRSGRTILAWPRAVALEPRQIRLLLSVVGLGLVSRASGLALARFAPYSYDSLIMLVVAKSLATTHNTIVPPGADPWGWMTPHSTYGLGTSLVESVGYLAALQSGHNPVTFAMLAN